MLNIASFLTPLAAKPDPNGGVANAHAGLSSMRQSNEEKARLGEQTRHSKELEGQQQQEFGLQKQIHQDTMGEHERELHTKLTEWAMGVLDKEGMDKAREIAGPVLDAAGIGVDFGGGTEQAAGAPPVTTGATVTGRTPLATGGDDDGFAKLQAVQAANAAKEAAPQTEGPGGGIPLGTPQLGQVEEQGIPSPTPKIPGEASPGIPLSTPKLGSNYAPRPGESLSQYVARGKSQVKAEEPPAPTESELDTEATEGPVKADAVEATRAIEGEAPAWRIYNKRTGETYGTIDPAKVQAINQERAYKGAVAYSKGTPEPGKAVVQEFTRGARDEADLDTRMKYAEAELNRQNKTQNALANHKGAVGPGQIGGPIDEKLLNQVNGQVRMYVSKAVDNSGVKALNTKGQDSARISGMISSGSSGAERQAFATQLHANFGAASSEGERAFQLEQAGVIQSLLAKVDGWVQSGQLPEGLKGEIQKVAQMQQDFARRYADEIRRKATKDVMESPALGGLYDRALGHPLSPEERDKIAAGVSNLGGIEGSEPAETGSADHEFDKLGL